MSLFEYLIEFSMFFFISLAVLYCMRKAGYAIGLTDKPNARKHHEGVAPLVGGISLCITLLYFLYMNAEQFNNLEVAATCLTVLVGVADDRFDISFKLRMGVQAILAMVIMHYTGLTLSHVGGVFGFGVLDFPVVLDSVITVIAVINAFNMVDGIDGLLACWPAGRLDHGGVFLIRCRVLRLWARVLCLFYGGHDDRFSCDLGVDWWHAVR
ncbi:Undecaprenyl-phosphate N-acetylglucosaminyl 1-phosphate transferase [Vibrio chagasii]|nr:Undecaprenyl-phosphate N-acetylglucosaminyl 1-phosphate transferase [Vibrio chagasii]CAH7324388.1 Undecaprenyl-phosphate N-acetylglucosaminyl 1-phosphate transferase [Vibrio chagasii]CAH7364500.1 Undecaprenyl-phosphate N-acetylglucosaminyl 1-phosphate transferase [Vibrio chagasii]CAH7412647.1 Undecaprenyl-phosphate N-acetylglucosaminyl 1-phosphate transferase [Vibrio chagasii]CAH7475859.1 Undecaprenyl-phosphate N-acetylglucosaminyl 1-phosphate transferase [Vibrio chagasii]